MIIKGYWKLTKEEIDNMSQEQLKDLEETIAWYDGYNKRYYAKNKEKLKAYRRKYYHEKQKQYYKDYADKNREHINKYNREYKQRQRESRIANLERAKKLREESFS